MLESEMNLKCLSNHREISNIALLSAASTISLLGTSVYNFAISLYVLKITGSGLSFATTLVIGILSTILVNPFAGAFADRLNKKFLVVLQDILCSLLLIGLYLFTTRYSLSVLTIYISTFFLNLFTTVYGISLEASKPNLVSEEKLISINSVSKIIESAASISGPMIGGMVFAFLDIRLFIIINGVSFFISALLELFIDFKFNYEDDNKIKEKLNVLKDLKTAAIYIKSKKNIVNMFGTFTAFNFFIGLSINVPLPFIINNVLKLDSDYFGIIEGSFSVGMILGAVLIKKIMKTYSYEKILKYSSILLSACMILIGFPSILHNQINSKTFYVVYFISVMILAGIAVSFIDIPLFYILQKTIPDELRGRVLSMGISAAKIVLPVALILSGALINLTPSYVLPIISGVLLCIFSILYIKIDL